MPSLKAAAEPASDEARKVIFLALANVTGKPDVMRNGSVAEQNQFWDIYHDALSHLPAAVLSRAAKAFVRAAPGPGGKWFPDPGTLLDFAKRDELFREQMKALHGLERLAKAKPEPEASEYVDITEADIARMVREKVKRAAELDAMESVERNAEADAALAAMRAKVPEKPFDNSLLLNVYARKRGQPEPEAKDQAA